ncbi:hypothetical protein [Dyadobacter sp. CY323]|uniref:hypothetical protein n=1 Tax=Dyadobacter sp. CY323 TaxID=2907302 RepID=UPI001F3803BF|nr:hypothetical protein [Dyadobacter sp. CY323]MCE6987498.1 hypothetical protein [Dyadobacter sp. CY323]
MKLIFQKFKSIMPVIALSFAVAVLIAGVAFFYRACSHKTPVANRKAIADSLRKYSKKRELHADSAKIYLEEYEFLTKKSDSLANLDSVAMDIRRAQYRAEWERKNAN